MVEAPAYPARLAANYEALKESRHMMETMRKNQALRGIEPYLERKKARAATHNSWRQMKGMQLFMHEINHPGNKPFVIGFCITGTLMMYMYYAGSTEQAKKDSVYYQRFIAKKDEHH